MREFSSLNEAEVDAFFSILDDSISPDSVINPISHGELLNDSDGHKVIRWGGDFWKASDDCLLSPTGMPYVSPELGPVCVITRDGTPLAIVKEDGRRSVQEL